MTDQAAHRGRTYQSGDWYGVIGPNVVIVLPPQEKGRVAALWALADEGAGFDETLDALISDGLRALHGFVLISSSDDDTKVVIRGEARATFVSAGAVVELEGSSVTTWVERSLREVTSMVLDVGDVADGAPSYAIEHGLVRVSRLSEGAPIDADAPDAVAPESDTPDENLEGRQDQDDAAIGRVGLLAGAAGVAAVPLAASSFGSGEGVDGEDTSVAGREPHLEPDLEPDLEPEVESHVETPPPAAVDDDGDDPLAATSLGAFDAVGTLDEDSTAATDETEQAADTVLDAPADPVDEDPEPVVEASSFDYDTPDVDPWIDPAGDLPTYVDEPVAERSFEDSFDTATPSPLDHDPVEDAAAEPGIEEDASGDLDDPLEATDIWSPTPIEPAEPLAYSSGPTTPAHVADLPADSSPPVLDEPYEPVVLDDELGSADLDEMPARPGAHAAEIVEQPDYAIEPDHEDEDEDEDDVLLPAGETPDHADDVADLDDDHPTETFAAQPDHDGLTHLSPFDQDEFALARPGIAGQAPAPPITSRPVARLMISTGDTVDVDRVVILGRAPMAPRGFTGQPLLVSVPSPHQEISSTHVEVRPGSGADHGMAVVTDLGSTNGTIVIQPGLEPDELQPGVSMQLIPGAVIDLGDGVIITVNRP